VTICRAPSRRRGVATPPGVRALHEPLLAAAAFFSGAALRVCDAMLPRLAQQFHLDVDDTASVIVAFSIAYSVTQLVSGPLGDRFGKPAVIFASLAGSAVAALGSALAPDPMTLVCTRALWGMSAAGIIPLCTAWIGDRVSYDRRQPALARLLFGTLSGMMAGQLLGGCLVDTRLGWRGAFALLAVGYLALAFKLRVDLRRDAVSPQGESDTIQRTAHFASHGRTVLSSRWARIVLFTTALEEPFCLGRLLSSRPHCTSVSPCRSAWRRHMRHRTRAVA
jgi:MFS family permease